MNKRITESKALTKDISCEYRFHERKCNSDQWWNNDKCQCECRKRYVCVKKSSDKCCVLAHFIIQPSFQNYSTTIEKKS